MITMSLSLAFSDIKPCCNNKTDQVVTCKLNHRTIEKAIDVDLRNETPGGTLKSYKCDTDDGNMCAKGSIKKPWWKFWVKKTSRTCTCRKANVLNRPSN